MMSEQQKLYSQIQKYSFAIVETVLFLDGHPDNKMALNYYNTLQGKLKPLVDEYEKKYGALTVTGTQDATVNDWSWVKTPWPWQMED